MLKVCFLVTNHADTLHLHHLNAGSLLNQLHCCYRNTKIGKSQFQCMLVLLIKLIHCFVRSMHYQKQLKHLKKQSSHVFPLFYTIIQHTIVSKLMTNNSCFIYVPSIVTHCTPFVVIAQLHCPLCGI